MKLSFIFANYSSKILGKYKYRVLIQVIHHRGGDIKFLTKIIKLLTLIFYIFYHNVQNHFWIVNVISNF